MYQIRSNIVILLADSSCRFTVGCYRTNDTSFKIRATTPILLSPNVKYGLNFVFQFEEREQIDQQYVPVRYTLQGEKKISFVYFADRRKDGWLVAELYQFTSDSDKSISDLEIIFECCQFSGFLYIEGIEFQPLERVEHPVVEYEEILKVVVPHVFYRSAEELKVLLFRGIPPNGLLVEARALAFYSTRLLAAGCGLAASLLKYWFSINDKEEHCLMLSIEDSLIREDPN
ncbi:kinase-like domain, phloem protein 2-like protein [Tanacetum coccineum]